MSSEQPLWRPAASARPEFLLSKFQSQAEKLAGRDFPSFWDLHAWSLEDTGAFWSLAWDFCGLHGRKGKRSLVPDPDPTKATFFPDAKLNVAETLLKAADDRDAIVFIGEDGQSLTWSRAELKRQVEMLAAGLRGLGIGPGDRVAGYVANMPQTVAAMLAAASLGAVWSSAAPESGPDVVVDRFGQIEPKVLFATDGYFYSGKRYDTRSAISEIVSRVPSVKQVVVWPYAGDATDLPQGMIAYDDFCVADAPSLICEPLGFRCPLYVVFSSGTTGKPKCIEHSGGGTFLRTMVEQQLHCDLRSGDRLFYYTTCNWMMWNWQVAALASEATIVLFDGNPMFPDRTRLFDIVRDHKITHFGTSAKFIETLQKRQVRPCDTHDLGPLRTVLSTGSPLSPGGFDHVYADWKSDVHLASICGGTDILGCFVGGCPDLPVYRGQIQVPILGLDIATLDGQGVPVRGLAGELVCRNAHPSMPTRFLHDPESVRYRDAYFSSFPNIWCQGDFTIKTDEGGYIVLGRSDATLNPGGVRIGTAEIYRQLDCIETVSDAVVVGQNHDNDVRVVLFVRLEDGAELSDELVVNVRTAIRKNASPRHVPAKILAVPDVPLTKSGKIAELAVRDVVNGHPVRNLSGIANPQALEHFKSRPELSD